MSDFYDVVLAQRACRLFRPDAVPVADIERILTAATHAPSAENMQPWVFVVVTDPDRRAQIGALARELWDGAARSYAEPHLAPRMLDEIDESMTRGFGGAPVIVIVAADHESGVYPTLLPASIFPCTQNLLLAANALGYGSALTTLTALVGDRLRSIVDLPASIEPMAIIPIGRPAQPLGPPRRRPVADVTHLNQFGATLE